MLEQILEDYSRKFTTKYTITLHHLRKYFVYIVMPDIIEFVPKWMDFYGYKARPLAGLE